MLKTLLLRNFRNYEEQKICFSSGKNVILGENAQGKSNLIEAISLITTGRSNRTSFLSECIAFNCSYFYLEASFLKEGIEQTIKLYYSKSKKQLTIDTKSFSIFSPIIGQNPSILHAPSDLHLISGPPSLRRKFLDLHLSTVDREYLHSLIYYYRAKKQRDCLLKEKKLEAIDCFEETMSTHAQTIYEKRKSTLERILPIFQTYAKEFLFDLDLMIEYLPSTPPPLLEVLQKNRAKEMLLGNTLFGPHRDDFAFILSNQPVKSFGSEGQKRACILALKLAEYQKLLSYSNNSIFCIDDMATHFDSTRQKQVENILDNFEQVIVTVPHTSPTFTKEARLMYVQEGILQEKPFLSCKTI